MAEELLQLLVRTPQGDAVDQEVTSLRVPSDTGQVGLRPRSEASALVVEPGLVLAATRQGTRYIATAGGLLRCDGKQVVLLTPVAVVGDSAETVGSKLEDALGMPTADRALRGVLQRLESGILQELRQTTSSGGSG